MLNLTDFFPKYPEIENIGDDLLDPYDVSFNQALYNKKEFNDLKLSTEEAKPPKGELYSHQKTIVRFMAKYDKLLLVHEMGQGKSCSILGSLEEIRKTGKFKRAYIFTRNPKIGENLKNELAYVCTTDLYEAESYYGEVLDDRQKKRNINKKVEVFYTFKTMDEITKDLKLLTDDKIFEKYSNCLFAFDEVHNLRYNTSPNSEYQQLHRLFHVPKNIKVILSSGTIMTDHPDEIASMLNLLLDKDKQLPVGDDFRSEYLYEKDGISYIKNAKKDALKKLLKGHVSYLKSRISNVDQEYQGILYKGSTPETSLKYFKIVPDMMSDFQTANYTIALNTDIKLGASDNLDEGSEDDYDEKNVVAEEKKVVVETKEKKNDKGVYNNSREATLFVYPDGSYGKKGFMKYIERVHTKVLGGKNMVITYKFKDFRLKKKDAKGRIIYEDTNEKGMTEILRGNTPEETINNIRTYSSIYADTLQHIYNNPTKLCFVYGKLIKGSGNILFSLLLELIGYKKAAIGEKTSGLRYFNIMSEIYTDDQISKILKFVSHPDNMTGKFVNVVISSKILSEGFTIKNLQEIHIQTPHWNFSETSQAIARGLRLNAHDSLIKAGITPKVKIYLHAGIPNNGIKSLDVDKYIISEKKDVGIKDVERLFKESAFDCELNLERNYSKFAKDYSRECEYKVCNYTCDGISEKYPKIEIDTYNLFYSDKKVDELISKIIEIFSREFYYTTFKFIEQFGKTYTQYEIIKAINKIVYHNIIIVNRYGYKNLLREENNILFLVDNITLIPVFSPSSYNKYPAIRDNIIYDESINDICIDFICNKSNKNISLYLDSLSHIVKQYLCELVITTNIKDPRLRNFFKIKGSTYIIDDIVYNGDKEVGKLQTAEEPVETISENDYKGYAGKYNEDFFCIKKYADDEHAIDPRKRTVGRVCNTSWQIPDLCKIVVDLQLPFKNFYLSKNMETINMNTLTRDDIIEELSLTKLNANLDEYKHLPMDDLKRILYYIMLKKNDICNKIQAFFEEKGVLYYDTMCGKTGHKKK